MEGKKPNLEKIGIYIAAIMGFLTIIFYIIDIKVDVAKLQVKVEYLEGKSVKNL